MWIRIVLLLGLIVTGYLKRIKPESDYSGNGLSRKMSDLIDKKINPCDNFYRFACGKYNGFTSILDDVTLNNKRHLLDILKYNLNNRNSINTTWANKLAIDLFESCMNFKKEGFQSIINLIKDYGGWPVVKGQKWNESNWVRLNMAKRILTEGFNMAPILKITDTSSKGLILELPNFVIDKGQLVDKRFFYLSVMVNVAISFGSSPYIALDEMMDVLSFELELVKNCKENEAVSPLTINEMKLNYPALMEFLRPFIEPNVTMKIISAPLQYIKSLELILTNTSQRTIANYLIWRVIVAASEYLSKEWWGRYITVALDSVKIGKKFKYRTPLPPVPISGIECLDSVNNLLPVALDSIYIKEKVELIYQLAEPVNELAENVQNEFIKIVENSVWMDDESKKKTINILRSIVFFIGNSHMDLPLRELNRLELFSNNYLRNILKIGKFHNKYPHKQVLSAWEARSQYLSKDNIIYIPVGALQWPNFDINAPLYFNYGALGHLFGHQIANAISAENHKLDTNGNPSIWLNITANKYINKVDRFKQQYSKIETETGIKLINQVISDNIGVKAAYRAYRKLRTAKKPSKGYTHRQLFWISIAQSHCGFVDFSDHRKFSSRSEHRVLGILKNIPEFANDFHCPHRSKKCEDCELWSNYIAPE